MRRRKIASIFLHPFPSIMHTRRTDLPSSAIQARKKARLSIENFGCRAFWSFFVSRARSFPLANNVVPNQLSVAV